MTRNRRLIIEVCLLLAAGVALYFLRFNQKQPRSGPTDNVGQVMNPAAAGGASIAAREERADATVWATERLAEQCGRRIESLWDSINASSNKLETVRAFPVGQVVLSQWAPPHELPHGIIVHEPTGAGSVASAAEWRALLEGWARAGWRLEQTEFRHNAFDLDDAGRPKQSRFYFSAHLVNDQAGERAALEGDLRIDWGEMTAGGDPPEVRSVDASRLTLKTRRGEPVFKLVLEEQLRPAPGNYFVDPLILYDLDGDGLSEIILAAKNLLYHRRGEHYEAEPLCRYPPGPIFTAVVADFDGDGLADFLCANFEGLVLFKGSPQGTFEAPGRQVWRAPGHLKYPSALTCGDIDHDGKLDLFLAQYKPPYQGGAMPTPYYDANDGNPAYLLHNDGRGNFMDVTTAAGLGQKRWRRTYSSSFVDLDGDGHLDLVVLSDFAGLDLYRNNGQGHFADVTRSWVPEVHAFGMGLALADFNCDGRLDLLMLGMPSPAADRLEHANLWRSDVTEDRTMRSRMTYGNRLLLAHPGGGFEQTAMSEAIARSGWSWGCSAFDFDNDGYPDVYIANGHESVQTVADYDPEYWLHDIYVGDSRDSPEADLYFKEKVARTRGRGQSYGGYDKNRLYWNQGSGFLEIAHLLGVGLEADCRNVVADDLDGDGLVDLLVTTFEVWPSVRQTLRVYRNTLPDPGNWIGFRFREEGPGKSPVGVRATLHFSGRSIVREIVTGDSYRSQHAPTLHFGIGKAQTVDVELSWPGGRILKLVHPEINRYHLVHAPTD